MSTDFTTHSISESVPSALWENVSYTIHSTSHLANQLSLSLPNTSYPRCSNADNSATSDCDDVYLINNLNNDKTLHDLSPDRSSHLRSQSLHLSWQLASFYQGKRRNDRRVHRLDWPVFAPFYCRKASARPYRHQENVHSTHPRIYRRRIPS